MIKCPLKHCSTNKILDSTPHNHTRKVKFSNTIIRKIKAKPKCDLFHFHAADPKNAPATPTDSGKYDRAIVGFVLNNLQMGS